MQEDKSVRIVPYVRICVGTNTGLSDCVPERVTYTYMYMYIRLYGTGDFMAFVLEIGQEDV